MLEVNAQEGRAFGKLNAQGRLASTEKADTGVRFFLRNKAALSDSYSNKAADIISCLTSSNGANFSVYRR